MRVTLALTLLILSAAAAGLTACRHDIGDEAEDLAGDVRGNVQRVGSEAEDLVDDARQSVRENLD